MDVVAIMNAIAMRDSNLVYGDAMVKPVYAHATAKGGSDASKPLHVDWDPVTWEWDQEKMRAFVKGKKPKVRISPL